MECINEKYLLKLMIALILIQFVVITCLFTLVFTKVDDSTSLTYYNNGDNTEGREIIVEEVERFDPEEKGFLMHEYYDKVHDKYPGFNTAVIKRRLERFGDLLIDNEGEKVESVSSNNNNNNNNNDLTLLPAVKRDIRNSFAIDNEEKKNFSYN